MDQNTIKNVKFYLKKFPSLYNYLRKVKNSSSKNKNLKKEIINFKSQTRDYLEKNYKKNYGEQIFPSQLLVKKKIQSNEEINLPEKVVIEINNTCNLDCLMCQTSLSTRKKGKMDMVSFKKIVDYCSKNSIREIELHTIGDPLMNPILDQILGYLREKKMFVGLTTNGLLIKKRYDILKNFQDIIGQLSISVDSPKKETYEIVRTKGNFEELIDNLAFAKKHLKTKLRMSMTISKLNYKELGSFVDFAKKYVTNLSEDLYFGFVGSLSPNSDFFDNNNLFPNQTRSNRLCGNMNGESLNFHINGDLSICARDYDGSLVIGNVNEDDPKNILNYSDNYRKIKNRHLENKLEGPCANCMTVDDSISIIFSSMMKIALQIFKTENFVIYDSFFENFEKFIKNPDPIKLKKLEKNLNI